MKPRTLTPEDWDELEEMDDHEPMAVEREEKIRRKQEKNMRKSLREEKFKRRQD